MSNGVNMQKKNNGRLMEIFSLFGTWAGVLIGILSEAVSETGEPGNFAIAAAIVSCELLVIAAWGIAQKYKCQTAKTIKEMEEAFEAKEAELDKQAAFLKNAVKYDADQIKIAHNWCMKLCDVHDREEIYRYYNKFISDVIFRQEKILHDYLESVGRASELSFSLKLFTEVYDRQSNVESSKVFTAFRDKAAYESHREVGGKYHPVTGNADFMQCLTEDYMIVHNWEGHANSNAPAHKNDYSTSAVASIYNGVGRDRRMFGYFTCDTLVAHGTKIFDENVAHLMRTAAYAICMFLEKADSVYNPGEGEEKELLAYLDRKCRENYKSKQVN